MRNKRRKRKRRKSLVENVDRLIRHKDYCPRTNPTALPNEKDFIELREKTKWIPLASVLHPDTDWKIIRKYQSTYEEINNWLKVPKGMKKSEIKEKWLPIVLELRGKGMSYNAIAKMTNLSKSVVYKWCKGIDI